MLTKPFSRFLCSLTLACTLTACGNQAVKTVREGTLDLDTTTSIGDALDHYRFFTRTEWHQTQDAQRRTLVECQGQMDIARFANASLPEMGTITPEAVAKFQQNTKGMIVSYVIRFALGKDGEHLEVQYGGLHIGGNHPQTGKPLSDDLPDKDLTTLKLIYKEQPDPMTMGLILGAQ